MLKVLGEKKFSRNHKYPPNTADLRAAKRRPYGSMSSLPSSVSSRPFRDRSRKLEDKKKVKDLKVQNRSIFFAHAIPSRNIKGSQRENFSIIKIVCVQSINRRFQRLESHVVTLARYDLYLLKILLLSVMRMVIFILFCLIPWSM